MYTSSFFRLLASVAVGTILVFLIVGAGLAHRFYIGIFRLSTIQVSDSLLGVTSQCQKIKDCALMPGDILIRRYITKRTWLIDALAHPYFTHSAFYLGDNQIVEAVGTEKNPEDEIQIAILSKSDWVDTDIESWVVIRPRNIPSKIEAVKKNLINIQKDPDYKFGLPKSGYKRATCADLIFKQLLDEGVIDIPNAPAIITPDYLFWIANRNSNDFEIIAYNVH